jgi:hypothetical protein
LGGLIIAAGGIPGLWLTVSALAGFSVLVFLLLGRFEDRLRYKQPKPAAGE